MITLIKKIPSAFLPVVLSIVYIVVGCIIGYNQGYEDGQKDLIFYKELEKESYSKND